MDLQHFSGSTCRFKIVATVVPQTQIQTLAERRLLDHVGMAFELIADCGSNEIGPIRIEALLDHEVDLPEVNVAEIDRDLLTVCGLWAELMYNLSHIPFHTPSVWMVYGWQSIAFKRERARSSRLGLLGSSHQGGAWMAARVTRHSNPLPVIGFLDAGSPDGTIANLDGIRRGHPASPNARMSRSNIS